LVLACWNFRAARSHRVPATFARPQCEAATLSPEGKQLAYLVRNGTNVKAYVMAAATATVTSSILPSRRPPRHRCRPQIQSLTPRHLPAQLGESDVVTMATDATLNLDHRDRYSFRRVFLGLPPRKRRLRLASNAGWQKPDRLRRQPRRLSQHRHDRARSAPDRLRRGVPRLL
jgi:hypothetical protein